MSSPQGTTDPEDVEARLRRVAERCERPYQSVEMSAGDALIAAHTVASLRAENLELREALAWIAANEVDPLDANRRTQLEAMIRRARAALGHRGVPE
jgi:hypothetical protein